MKKTVIAGKILVTQWQKETDAIGAWLSSSEMGAWLLENSIDMFTEKYATVDHFDKMIRMCAVLTDADATFFYLKFGDNSNIIFTI